MAVQDRDAHSLPLDIMKPAKNKANAVDVNSTIRLKNIIETKCTIIISNSNI